MIFNPPSILNFQGLELGLDCKAENVFISHAHFDHITKKSRKTLASKETIELMKVRGVETQKIEKELKAELLNAGHVLGSRQLRVEGDGQVFTYTGDFKLSDSITGKAEVRQTDYLLIEATYGKPEYVFPERNEVYDNITKWVKRNQELNIITILGGYELGKAQELIHLMNKEGITPLVGGEIAKISEVYNHYGFNLKFIDINSEEAQEELKTSFVSILSPFKIKKELPQIKSNKKIDYTTPSGWSKKFILSDHADFNELIEYVEASEAKKVFCTHGFSKELASELKKKGFNAVAVDDLKVKTELRELMVSV